jgi:hypothetical protein
MEEKVTDQNIEVAIVSSRGFHLYTTEELAVILARH